MSTRILPTPPLDFFRTSGSFAKGCLESSNHFKGLNQTDRHILLFFMSMNYVSPLFLFRRHVKRNGGSTRVRTLSK